MMNLLPCTQTAGAMFCSENCRDKIYSRSLNPTKLILDAKHVNGPKLLSVGLVAFGTAEKLGDFVKNYEIKSGDKTIFDYDLNNPSSKNYKKNIMNCLLSLQYKKFTKSDRNFGEMQYNLLKFMNHISGIIEMNSIGLQYLDITTIGHTAPTYELHGQAVLAFGSLLNHSCNPNVQRIAVDNKIALVVCKQIEPNQQLFINYV